VPAVTGIAKALGKWQEIDQHYSCIFPASREPDPALVKDVRLTIPDFVPVLLKRIYATPEGHEVYIEFVCEGQWKERADEPDCLPLMVERPYKFPFRGGVIYHKRTLSTGLMGIPAPEVWKARGIEDLPLPFDAKMADWLKGAYRTKAHQTAKEMRRDAVQQIVNDEKARQKIVDELDEDKSREFCDKVASPGFDKDAQWEMSHGGVNA
jgi:hypothetical protein